jgi:hypothetical protein
LARFIAMRAVVQLQQACHFVEAEAQALCGLHELHAGDVLGLIAPDAAIGPVGLGQQGPALVEANRLHVDPGRLGDGPDGQAVLFSFHSA